MLTSFGASIGDILRRGAPLSLEQWVDGDKYNLVGLTSQGWVSNVIISYEFTTLAGSPRQGDSHFRKSFALEGLPFVAKMTIIDGVRNHTRGKIFYDRG